MKLGFNKLNGRYIWIAGVISLTLLVTTIYAQYLVTNSAREGYSVIQKNTRLLQQVSSITHRIQRIESNVLKYTTSLDDETRFSAETDLEQLQVELLSLVQYVHIPVAKNYLDAVNNNDIAVAISEVEKQELKDGYTEIDQHVDELVVTIQGLRLNIMKYFEVMSNVRTRYPGMPYLLDFLAPNNILFSEAVESALQESNMTDAQIGELDKHQYQIVNLFQAIRYAWAQKVSWLRVMVSNRMGAFGDPIKSMKRNLANRKIYAAEVGTILVKLEKYKEKNLLGLQQEESLEIMHKASEGYEEHFNKAISVYFSENWRADLPILKRDINPNFKLLRETVAKIEHVINKNANKGITASLFTANLLTSFIWFFATSVIALMFIFYFIFKRAIRDPVLNVAQAMEAEARGEPYKLNKVHKVYEIRLLDRAFNYMRNEVHSRQQYLEAIFSNAAEGILTIHIDGSIESMNDAGLKLFGLTKKSCANKNISELIHQYKETELYKIFKNNNSFVGIDFEGEVNALNKNNETFPLLVKVSQMQSGSDILYILIVQDISEQKSLLQNLQHVAEHDALTGLYNRQYYSDNLERIIELAHREESYKIVCMFLDLDNFKYVNDTLGHMAGDRLLKEITSLLRNRMRKSDLLARIGGDEFSLIFQGIDIDAAIVLANEYRQCIDEYQFTENGKTINIGCSIGLAAMTSEIETKDELLSRADVACHEAKCKGKNCIHVYELSDKQKTDSLSIDMGWALRIKNAIGNNHFVFAKQKICHTGSNEIFAEEYLIRMLDDKAQGLIMPSGFLNSAERFGLMPDIDRWVVENALQTYAADMDKASGDLPCISINLSAKSVGHPEIVDAINESIEKYSIDPSKIIFEITEDVAISDFPNAIIFLNNLRAMGCATALDDFGAGYSSFSYLKEFPVDYVKIDGSFIVGIENNKLNYALVKAMHDVCSTLNKKTVVEFVENQQALDVLKEIGVDYVQGFHIGRPELLDKDDAALSPVLNESVQ